MADINVLADAVLKFRDERDWKQYHNPKDVALSLVLEATEVMEHFQWISAEELTAHVIKNKEQIGEELADVLYWVLLMSRDLEIDLSSALLRKLESNSDKYPIEKAKGKKTKYDQL